MFPTIDHPTLGSFRTISAPLHMSAHTMPANLPGPALGAHSREILAEAGLSDDEISLVLESGSNS